MMESLKILSLALVYRRFFGGNTHHHIMKKRNACLRNAFNLGVIS